MSIFNNKSVIKATYITHKICSTAFYVALVLFAAWFGWSVVEVWIHNATMFSPNPHQYSYINMFQLLMP